MSSIFLSSDQEGYDWLDYNSSVQSRPCDYTNSVLNIAREPDMVAINGAIGVPLLFICLLFVMAVKLRKSPFDFAACRHAHQELVGGVLTDYSGPFLALIEVGHWFETVLMLGICSLFWAGNWAAMLALAGAAYLAVVWLDNVTARMNWRLLFGYAWLLGLPLALINLFWLYRG